MPYSVCIYIPLQCYIKYLHVFHCDIVFSKYVQSMEILHFAYEYIPL